MTFVFGEFTIEINFDKGTLVGGTHLHITGVVRAGEVVGDYLAVFTGPEADLVNFVIRDIKSLEWTKPTNDYNNAFAQFRKLR